MKSEARVPEIRKSAITMLVALNGRRCHDYNNARTIFQEVEGESRFSFNLGGGIIIDFAMMCPKSWEVLAPGRPRKLQPTWCVTCTDLHKRPGDLLSDHFALEVPLCTGITPGQGLTLSAGRQDSPCTCILCPH